MIQVKFNDKAKQVLADTLDLSGSVVVTELPQVGDEHTIYELRETSKGAYNWVAMSTQEMMNDNVATVSEVTGALLIFDTYTQMTNIFDNIPITGPVPAILVYLKNEDKLYYTYDRKGGWGFTETEKQSNYIFGPFMEDAPLTYVLKSYEGYDETDDRCYGTLYDDTKVELGKFDKGFILHQTNLGGMSMFVCVMDLQTVPVGPTLYTEIPYNDIIQNPLNFQKWIFKPEQGGEKISYWIYTNNEWINTEAVGTIVLPVVSYGTSGKDDGLELSNFEFTVNGNKVDCVQYKINAVEGGTSYAGYVTGISLPTENNTTYSISVRFIGESSQISETDDLILKSYDNTESNMLEGLNILFGTMNLEITDINTLSIVFMGSLGENLTIKQHSSYLPKTLN